MTIATVQAVGQANVVDESSTCGRVVDIGVDLVSVRSVVSFQTRCWATEPVATVDVCSTSTTGGQSVIAGGVDPVRALAVALIETLSHASIMDQSELLHVQASTQAMVPCVMHLNFRYVEKPALRQV
jgi:hypothetical protein